MSTFTMKEPYFYIDDHSSEDVNPPSNKRMKLEEGANFHYNSFEEIAARNKQHTRLLVILAARSQLVNECVLHSSVTLQAENQYDSGCCSEKHTRQPEFKMCVLQCAGNAF